MNRVMVPCVEPVRMWEYRIVPSASCFVDEPFSLGSHASPGIDTVAPTSSAIDTVAWRCALIRSAKNGASEQLLSQNERHRPPSVEPPPPGHPRPDSDSRFSKECSASRLSPHAALSDKNGLLSNAGLRLLGTANLAANLTSLVLSASIGDSFLDAESFQLLAAQFPNLVWLNMSTQMSYGSVTDMAWQHRFSNLAALKNLKTLVLTFCSLTADSIKHICDISSLTTLDLSNNPSSLDDAALSHLGNLPLLTEVDLFTYLLKKKARALFTDAGFASLAVRVRRQHHSASSNGGAFFYLQRLVLSGTRCRVGPNLRTLMEAGVEVVRGK